MASIDPAGDSLSDELLQIGGRNAIPNIRSRTRIVKAAQEKRIAVAGPAQFNYNPEKESARSLTAILSLSATQHGLRNPAFCSQP
ncbi:MAG TPA: hypothetical protein VNX18_05220 [Bryobacteraceae bacterium]|nr:hypothetical protein [Bryobacteraceae bacterium]